MENLGSDSCRDEQVEQIAAYIWAMCEGIAPEKYTAMAGRGRAMYDYHAKQILALAAPAVSEAQMERLWYDYLRRSDDLGAKKAFVEVVSKVAAPHMGADTASRAIDPEDLRLQDAYWTLRKHWPMEAAAWWRLRSSLTEAIGDIQVLEGYALRHINSPCPIVFADPEDAWKYLHDQYPKGSLVGKKEEWRVYPVYRRELTARSAPEASEGSKGNTRDTGPQGTDPGPTQPKEGA